jgi:hypothetical protein
MSRSTFGLLGLLLFGVSTAASGQTAGSAGPAERAVLSVEEDFRLAQLRNDTSALNRILAASFYETNQNGNSRDKAATIALWTSFRIRSRTIERSEVRFTGDTAVVTGVESEENASGVDHMLFMRTYARMGRGWVLAGAVHFRDPNERFR